MKLRVHVAIGQITIVSSGPEEWILKLHDQYRDLMISNRPET